MLEVVSCRHLHDKQKAFGGFNPVVETWVVSDLQSKTHLQEQLLRRFGVLERNAVLRATELWKALSFQVCPEVRLLSPELAQTLFWNWIEPMDLTWARSPQAVPVLLKQMKMWIGLVGDPRHEELMAQWFQDNGEAYVRFGHWFELCATLWRRCQDENLMMLDWLPALLLNQELAALHWPKALIFDLGPQISLVEGQLIKDLSRDHRVRVLFPEAPWLGLMKNTLKPYDLLRDEVYQGDPSWQPEVHSSYSFGRYSTQLAEVKDAVSRIRKWLEQGVSPDHMAVAAPDIEDYWPTLQMYFEQEGIPVAKAVNAKLGSFSDMAQWLSTLRTRHRQLSTHDLEMHFFSQKESSRLSYAEFRILFSRIYDGRDMERARELFTSDEELDQDGVFTLAEYLGWSLRLWRGQDDQQRLMSLLHVLGQEVPADLKMRPPEWLSYIEGIAARREIALKPGGEKGIWCVSLASADWLPVSHGIFLNLCEDALRRLDNSPVGPGQAHKIFTDTGFAMASGDRQELEFELLWFLNRRWENLHLSFAGTDFQGSVLTPSRLWMWAAFINGQLKKEPQMPGITRWDEIQALDFASQSRLRMRTERGAHELEMALLRDAGSAPVEPWGGTEAIRVSASSLERFWECPFIFATERGFKLNDDPVLDLDLDRRTRGRLLHALVEELTKEPMKFDLLDAELERVIETCRERENVRMGDRRLWPAIRAQYMRLARQFLTFERQTRERFPALRTMARELGFACYWDVVQGQPTAEPTPVHLAGRLDRVDADSRHRYALIDYKTSSAGNVNWSSWLKNHSIQLPLYSLLLERGLAGLPAAPVVAATYYVVRDNDRRKGFHLKDDGCELYSLDDGHRNLIGEEQKQVLFSEVLQAINAAIVAIQKGEFPARPEDEKTCTSCSWRNICRAPHLN